MSLEVAWLREDNYLWVRVLRSKYGESIIRCLYDGEIYLKLLIGFRGKCFSLSWKRQFSYILGGSLVETRCSPQKTDFLLCSIISQKHQLVMDMGSVVGDVWFWCFRDFLTLLNFLNFWTFGICLLDQT